MVMKYGMSEKVGLITYGKDDDNVFLGRDIMKRHYCSEKTSETIDAEVKRIVDEAYLKTKETLSKYMERMDFIVSRLLECEVMEGEELKEIMEAENLDELREKYKLEDEQKAKAKEAEKEAEKAEEAEEDDEDEIDEDDDKDTNDPFSFLTNKSHIVDLNKHKKDQDEWWIDKEQNEATNDPYLKTVNEGINRVYYILIGVEFGIQEEYDENKDYEKIFLYYKNIIDNKKNSEHLVENIKDKNKEENDKEENDSK